MEQATNKFMKIMLILNLVMSSLAVIGVGYVVYKENNRPTVSMNRGGNFQGIPGGRNRYNQQKQAPEDAQ